MILPLIPEGPMSHSCKSLDADAALIQTISIAAPCDVPWDSMNGDERTRFCGQCKLNVYNISDMSTKEAAALVRGTEGRLCVKLYRRADGTVITDNCPVGLRKVRDRIKRCAAAVILALAWVGVISSAHAQGLVGAPVDVRYGVPGEYVGREIPVQSFETANILLTIASWFSCISIAFMLFSKRARLPLVGIVLLSIWAFTGFMLGVCTHYQVNIAHLPCNPLDYLYSQINRLQPLSSGLF